MELRDVRMVQRGEDLRFAVEAGEALGIPREEIRQNLDRNVTIEASVPRAEHFAHAAGAERREHFKRTQAIANNHRHGATMILPIERVTAK